MPEDDGRYGPLGASISRGRILQLIGGVDDGILDYGSVVFHAIADSEEIYTSDILTGSSKTEQIDVSISSIEFVNLLVTNADDGKTGDHAGWAPAKFHSSE